MRDFMINGKPETCFLLKEGDAAYIVIPVGKLDRIDYTRLKEIEDMDGEMLYNMSQKTDDNGMNLLDMYSTYIETIHKPKNVETKDEKKETEDRKPSTTTTRKKRGPGRPPKNPN